MAAVFCDHEPLCIVEFTMFQKEMMSAHGSRTYLTTYCIRNAEFDVKLEYIGAVFGALPSYEDFLAKATKQSTSVLCEQIALKWQQKVPHPCNDALVPSSVMFFMHIAVRKWSDLFARTLEQQKQSKVESETPMSIDKRNDITERISNSRNRRIAPTSYGGRNPVIDLPVKEHMMKSRSIYRQTKTMFIMAYLGPFDKDSESYDPNDDQVICKITAINEKTIIFEPDAASDSIRLESRYGIYSASLSIDGTKFDEISLMEQEDDWIQSREGSSTFDVVEEGAMKLDYLIQIERAMGFPHDGLYAEYKVELPGALVPTGVQTMGGRTQIAYSNENDVATFAHLIPLSISTGRSDTETEFFMPRVLLRVCAESAWGRHYVDGYGVASLPIMPGRHEITVNCWRPVNRMSRKAALQERFVSQAVDVKSFEECCFKNPLATMGKRTSWIGLTAETSGELQLKVDCIVQSRLFISQEHLRQMKYGTMMNRFGLHSNIHWRILKALLDFEEAKKHLLQVRSQRIPRLDFNV
uniref:Uncharacterized protein n=1 Tax=Ascaris lumbricoides TaxID=6252 RepID=A0A9J2P2R2_ASCLU